MNGLIFLALDDFLETHKGAGAWSEAIDSVGLEQQSFEPEYFYPDQVAADLFVAVAKKLEMPLSEMLEKFGRHLVPGLVKMGHHMGLVKKSWRTIDILEHLQEPILSSFSNIDEGILAPEIRVYRLKHSEVAIAYVSKRKLCHLLKGIVMGMGEYFSEPIMFKERVCMHKGNGPLCRLTVYLDDPNMVHYVDINREFKIVHSRIEELNFYNQFSGIPINHPGLVLQFGTNEVVIQAPREQLVAMKEEGKTYISVNHLPIGLKAMVKEVEVKGGYATLHDFHMTNGAVGQRCYKRVEPKKRFAITINIAGTDYKGEVHNISGGGVKISLHESVHLNETFLFMSVSLAFSLPLKWVQKGDTMELGPQKLSLEGNILDITEDEKERTARIMFTTLTGHNLFLMDQYYQRYLEDAQPLIHEKMRKI
ncbi:MAG: heme NO-binding domain-containing protein [Magnetococcales bacterium]|nr:heme NO-binding domain-containing protein [Magnetococcales bacterium]